MIWSYSFHRTETAFFLKGLKHQLLSPGPASLSSCWLWNSPYLPGTFTGIGNASLFLLAPNIFSPVIDSRSLSTENYLCDVTAAHPALYSTTFLSSLPHATPFRNDNLKCISFVKKGYTVTPFPECRATRVGSIEKHCLSITSFWLECNYGFLSGISICLGSIFTSWNEIGGSETAPSWEAILMALGQKCLFLISSDLKYFTSNTLLKILS